MFEGYDDAKSALISSILKQLMDNKRFPVELKDKAIKLVKRVNWMRLMKMGWDNVDFRDKFADLLRDSKFRSLVVLIDDLDRCSPDRIVDNLEAIRLFLNVDRTAFVIGADPRIVRHGIAVRYQQALEAARSSPSFGENPAEAAEQLVRDYVEKLIQIPYHLPRLSPAEIETYLSLLFAKRDLPPDDFKVCLAECEKFRAGNRFGPFGLSDIQQALRGKALPPVLKEALSFTAGAAHLITENLKGNPRQVKRFLNAFVLRRKLAKVARMEMLRDDVLLKLMLLEYSNETRFRELARWHEEQNETPKQIHDMEADRDWPQEWAQKDSLRRWVSMEPKLSTVDLSEYFGLVRDRLSSSQIGLSLTPPAVKACYGALLSESGRKGAASLLKGLREAEVDALVSLLSKALQRDPKNAEAYQGFMKLIETLPTGLPQFGSLIKNLPPDALPAWLATRLELLAKQNTSLRAPVDDLLMHLNTTARG